MVSQAGPRVARANSCKGPAYPGKGPKKSQKGQTKILGSASVIWDKFLKFVPKRANLSALARGMI